MTDRPKPIAGRWKSHIRLLLQVLAVLVVAIGGWTGWILYTARVQNDAVAAIERAGGVVGYDWELRDGPLVPTPKPPWLKWIVDHVGVDCFTNVVWVNLGKKATDAELARVGKLGLVDHLDARDSTITDAGLAHLKGLTALRYLNLSDTPITDAGLAHLKGLTRLETLHLSSTRVTEAGLASLEPLKNLQTLGLWKADISDERALELQRSIPRARTSR